MLPRFMLLSALLAAFSGLAQARPVALGGVLISPEVQTRPLTGAVEGLPVEVLPRLGVAVQNSSSGLSLSYAGRTLTFVGGRWLAQNIASVPATLPVPEGLGGGLYVVDLDSRQAAQDFIEADPFFQAGLFANVSITRWRKAYLAGECCL